MKTLRQVIGGVFLVGLLLFITGCIVYEVPYPSHTEVTYGPGQRIVYSDAEWVVWHYYDWDEDVVLQLHSLNYSNDEVSLILFLAYYGHTRPAVIVQWRQAGISWMEITTTYLRLEPAIFFVSLPPETRLGPPYGRAYGHYWRSPHDVVLTDAEMVHLVYLKTVSEAYQVPPREVITVYEQHPDFNYIVRQHKQQGRFIRTKQGHEIHDNNLEHPERPPKDNPDKDKSDKDKSGDDNINKDNPGNGQPDKDNPDKGKGGKDKPGKDKPGKGK